MSSIAQMISDRDFATLVATMRDSADGLRADAAVRDQIRPRAHDGRPYAAWRRQERAYMAMVDLERTMAARPGPAKRPGRAWDPNRVWYGTRRTAPIPSDSVLTRQVGPYDGNGVRLWSGHTIHW